MLTREEYNYYKGKVLNYFDKSNIVLTETEKEKIEIADFGLERLEEFGLQLIEYVNTERVCSKDLVLLPAQTCPEHKHPDIGESPGKEETFRCRYGKVFLYVSGEDTLNPKSSVPKDKKQYFTVWNEVVLSPGKQFTIPPNTLHWFQAGKEGAVISEFSTQSTDENDIFTDPCVQRAPEIK